MNLETLKLLLKQQRIEEAFDYAFPGSANKGKDDSLSNKLMRLFMELLKS